MTGYLSIMILTVLDWIIVAATLLVSLLIGITVARRSGQNSTEYFLSGRNMPWWLLGISMVATTFSADTPNLVTDIVRNNGVAGNWVWWAFLLTGMLTVFVYAKLWRRAGVFTDLEFYEMRYSGRSASYLRMFRAIYLGVFFNVMIMASVNLAAIKIGGVMLDASPEAVLITVSLITLGYTTLGGLRAVILTDLFQFAVAMIGTILAAIYIFDLPEVEGLSFVLNHENVAGKTSFLPDFTDPTTLIPLFIIPLAVQWWSVWYPGAEPGGGGYIAQRMLSAKDENHAVGATLLFNFAHYAVRPWPWILIALASLIVFPDLQSLGQAFPGVDAQYLKHDLAYPAMLTLLPSGLVGLLIGSMAAALMSTISTHLNWGSSYITHDVYTRFIKPEASEKEKVAIGRWTTVLLLILSAIAALYLESALDTLNILLQIGAGTGLLFILRWFWWRINAWSEISAMVISFIFALAVNFTDLKYLPPWINLLSGVIITTIGWVLVTFLTQPTDSQTLRTFCETIRPYPMGWKKIWTGSSDGNSVGKDIGKMVFGTIMVYCVLFGTGFLLYASYGSAILCFSIAVLCAWMLYTLSRQRTVG